MPFVLNVRLVIWASLLSGAFHTLFAADGKHWAVFINSHSTMEVGRVVWMVGKMAIGKVMVTSSVLLLLGVPPPLSQPNVGEKRLKGLLANA